MKKVFSLLSGVLFAFSLFFISCDDNEVVQDTSICNVTVHNSGYGGVEILNYIGKSVDVVIGDEVTVVATPYDESDFLGWFIGDDETSVTADSIYTFVVTESVDLTAKFSKSVVTICSAGYGSVSFKDSTDSLLVVLPGTEVTAVATPHADCEFIGWFAGDKTPVCADAEYTFIVEEDTVLTAQFAPLPINGYEWVGLGLPSGVKWATCNVGALTPEGYGGYYAWGETEEKNVYDWSTYKLCSGNQYALTKYSTNSSYGVVDDKTVLEPEDDVARAKLGERWRVPTLEEQQELLDCCVWQWTALNGVNGYKVTGPSGYSIFLPAAGNRYGAEVNGRGEHGNYFSSSLSSYGCNAACYMLFGNGNRNWGSSPRYYGYSVRPVCK